MQKLLAISVAMLSLLEANILNSDMLSYIKKLEAQAVKENPNFTKFNYKRGEDIFTSKHIGKRGTIVSCVSCHGSNLNKSGENINTNKLIEPLSPMANNKRFIKVKTVKKWIRRNFRDVYNRVGTAQEKGDVIIYMINKK